MLLCRSRRPVPDSSLQLKLCSSFARCPFCGVFAFSSFEFLINLQRLQCFHRTIMVFMDNNADRHHLQIDLKLTPIHTLDFYQIAVCSLVILRTIGRFLYSQWTYITSEQQDRTENLRNTQPDDPKLQGNGRRQGKKKHPEKDPRI